MTRLGWDVTVVTGGFSCILLVGELVAKEFSHFSG